MLEVFLIVVAALALIVVAMLAVASRRPDSFRVQRTLRVFATPDRIYPEIVMLKAFNTWNPYALRDPDSRVTYEGPESGVGARHRFDGKKSGSGYVEITGVKPDEAVFMRLVMTKPFQADNTIEFLLVPATGGTDVTWAMHGKQPLMAKVMTLFIDCDRMVGGDFEIGLKSLKAKLEG